MTEWSGMNRGALDLAQSVEQPQTLINPRLWRGGELSRRLGMARSNVERQGGPVLGISGFSPRPGLTGAGLLDVNGGFAGWKNPRVDPGQYIADSGSCSIGLPTPNAGLQLGHWPLSSNLLPTSGILGSLFNDGTYPQTDVFGTLGGKPCLAHYGGGGASSLGTHQLMFPAIKSALRGRSATICACFYIQWPTGAGSNFFRSFMPNAASIRLDADMANGCAWSIQQPAFSAGSTPTLLNGSFLPWFGGGAAPSMPTGWYHLAATIDNNGSTCTGTIYLNGAINKQQSWSTSSPCSTPYQASVDDAYAEALQWEQGTSGTDMGIRNVRAYLYAMTPSQIAELASNDL